jgi:hypothetical protein
MLGGQRRQPQHADAYRHSTAHGCTTVNATVIDTTMMNASPTNASTTTACKGVS